MYNDRAKLARILRFPHAVKKGLGILLNCHLRRSNLPLYHRDDKHPQQPVQPHLLAAVVNVLQQTQL